MVVSYRWSPSENESRLKYYDRADATADIVDADC